MKFSLALFIKHKGHSILLLLLCIVISLLLSDIPWLVNFLNGKTSQEGMISDDSINTINKTLNDKYATGAQKLAVIKGIADVMETMKDQNIYLTILNDGTKNEKEKIDDITKEVDKYLNSTTKLTKDATSSVKKDQTEETTKLKNDTSLTNDTKTSTKDTMISSEDYDTTK